MNLCDTPSAPRGALHVQVFRRGVLIDEWEDANLIVNVAKTTLAQLIGGAGAGKTVTKIGFGTAGGGPSPDDTALSSAYQKNLGAVSYPAAGQVRFSWTLATSEANGKAIREFGLICSDGSLFSRKVRGVIEKENDISLSGTWTITF
ncbi:hypothetical protein [Geoalkalibacter halelectricus]|uniref:hypothetical protein n=1 Tax=Geoalkalibacter halelectricus TaxID=2847045 RepID=UPI003D1E2D1D